MFDFGKCLVSVDVLLSRLFDQRCAAFYLFVAKKGFLLELMKKFSPQNMFLLHVFT